MNLQDFSNGFDTLLFSYAGRAMFGENASKETLHLDEYEKSLFLTRYQEELILSLYNGRNSSGRSFEETEELRRSLSPLVGDTVLDPIEEGYYTGVDKNSKFFDLPDDLWFITYESVNLADGKCGEGSTQEVVPVTQDEYNRLKKNPFRGPNDRRALRLDLADGIVEIVSKYEIGSYYLRYLKRLSPIILENLPDGLTINDECCASECILPEFLHQRILDGAVAMALQMRGYYVNENK